MKLLVGTRSAHKMAEIRRILATVPDLVLLDPNEAGVPYLAEENELEPWDTFERNALSKARYFRRHSGLPSVADDSGLEVDALGGAPGVRSKRFAPVPPDTEGAARDRANNEHLLRLLEGKPPEERGARYVCVVALDRGDGRVETVRGEAPGRIVRTPRGAGGFGYDPLFFDPELGSTFAEVTAEEKDARSHRGRAFRALAELLRREGPRAP